MSVSRTIIKKYVTHVGPTCDSLSLLSVPPLYISLSPALQSARSGGAPSWRALLETPAGRRRRTAALRQGRRDGHLHGEEVGGEGWEEWRDEGSPADDEERDPLLVLQFDAFFFKLFKGSRPQRTGNVWFHLTQTLVYSCYKWRLPYGIIPSPLVRLSTYL